MENKIIKRWMRIESPKGLYLYNESKDDLCVATTINVAEEDLWTIVDGDFATAWKESHYPEEEVTDNIE